MTRVRLFTVVVGFCAFAVTASVVFLVRRSDPTTEAVNRFVELWSTAREVDAVRIILPSPTFQPDRAVRILKAIRAELGSADVRREQYTGGPWKLYMLSHYPGDPAKGSTYKLVFAGGAEVYLGVKRPIEPDSGSIASHSIGGVVFFAEIGDPSIERLCEAAQRAEISE